MDAEEVMKLFDSCWFESEFCKKHQQPSSSNSEANPDQEIQENSSKLEISRIPTLHTRLTRDQLSSKTSFIANSLSPSSALFSPKLHTILSGNEISEENAEQTHSGSPSKKAIANRRSRTKKGLSKSLSDLEFEELKGFMDLGFVFSEEDKLSSLGSTIPGLQRLGKKLDGDRAKNVVVYEPAVSRPYLSEAWEVLDRRKKEKPLMNWRVPSLSNEIGMKNSLRSWAHSVASAVK